MRLWLGLSLWLASGLCVFAKDYDYVAECPAENGYFADALQCDRYYECKLGEVEEKFCPDGLVFDETSTAFAKCSFPFSVDCTGREQLQKAQPSPGCPRKNGYFPHPDPKVCDVFHFCVDGVPNSVNCPSGLIFDPTKGQCSWSDQTDRKGCTSEDLNNFKCPPGESSAHEHPRYPDPTDCQFFFLCISGKSRRNGCGEGMVFNPATLSCDRQDNVEGRCGSWYNETYLESLGATAAAKARPLTGVPLNSEAQERRKRPQAPVLAQRQQAVARPEVGEAQEELDLEALPPQLAALAGNRGLGFQGGARQNRPAAEAAAAAVGGARPSRPAAEAAAATFGGARPSKPVAEAAADDSARFQGGERQTFLDSLRAQIGPESGPAPQQQQLRPVPTAPARPPTTPAPPTAAAREPFTRPPRRNLEAASAAAATRPAPPQFTATASTRPASEEGGGDGGFGRRRVVQQSRVPPRVQQQQAEESAGQQIRNRQPAGQPVARRNQDLGPADLDSAFKKTAEVSNQGVAGDFSDERIAVARGGAQFSRGGLPRREPSEESRLSGPRRENAQDGRATTAPRREPAEDGRSFTAPTRDSAAAGERTVARQRRPQNGSRRVEEKGRRGQLPDEETAELSPAELHAKQVDEERQRRAEELLRREEEKARRDQDLVHREEEKVRREQELFRREEELVNREHEEVRRQEELARRKEERKRTEQEEAVRQEEEVRRKEEKVRREQEEARRVEEKQRVEQEETARQEELVRRKEEAARVEQELLAREELQQRRADEDEKRRKAAANDGSVAEVAATAARGFSRGGSPARGSSGSTDQQPQQHQQQPQQQQRSRGRLEITQNKALPPLRTIEEDPGDFTHFSPVRQRSRGAQ